LAKLIKILAASVGGGLVLGAGIRLGEAIAGQIQVSGMEPSHKLAERLGELENRLLNLEAESPAAVGSPMPHSRESVVQPEMERQPDLKSGPTDVLGETTLRLRGELRDWLEESVTVRMGEVETRLRMESERGQKQMLDAFAESVQTRVMHRISRLEEEVAGQSAAMNELRECSLRTELSVHKLLGGLDRLIVKNPPAAEGAPAPEGDAEEVNPVPAPVIASAESGPEPPPVFEPPAFEARPKSRRWKIFG
jgi:uncharacterized coiled-coil protein SlyX